MPRLVIYLIAIPLLLIILAGILIPLLLDKDKVVELASRALYEQSGASLQVDGDIDLSLFPTLGVSLEQATLSMPDGEGADIRVRFLELGVRLMPLLSRQIEIDAISLDGVSARIKAAEEQPKVDTSGLSDAELDAFYAQRKAAMAEAGKAAGGEAVLAAPLALNVGLLTITDLRLELMEPGSEDPRIIRLEQLEASGLNLDNRPIPLEFALQLDGDRPTRLAVEGLLRVAQDTQTVTLEQARILLEGVTIEPLELQADGTIDIARQVAELNMGLTLGETEGQGTVHYASFESPQIDARLTFNQFNPALMALAGPEAVEKGAADPGPESAGGDEPLPLDAIRSIDTRAELDIGQAVFGAHTIKDLQVTLRAMDGEVRIPRLTGLLHGGELAAEAVFNGRHNTASLQTSGSLSGLDLATALEAVESQPVLTGAATLDWKLTSSGRTVNELVAALDGPLALTTGNVVLQDMAVEKMFCQAVALVNQQRLSADFPSSSPLRDLAADIQIGKGKARLNPLRADLDHIALRGKGNFDLLSHDFKADFAARISPELGTLDPACQINKRYTSIDWPVKCKGNVAEDPEGWCGVDTGEIIEDLAREEVERKLEKEAGKLFKKFIK